VGDTRLSSPRLRIIRDGQDDLEVQTDNRDMLLWERTRAKHKWPKFDEAPFVWMTFIGWAAARRTGAIESSYLFERWEQDVIGVESVSDDDTTEDDTGRPMQAGVDPA